jgi:hypothetical protein
MDNVCRDCGRKFLSDLRYCPRCGGDAIPPRTRSWHYRETGLIAHTDPLEEQEHKAYKQNGWVMLCLGILLIPFWLSGLDTIMDEMAFDGPDPYHIALFIIATALLAFVFVAVIFAFQSRRPGSQVMAALFIVITVNVWHFLAWSLMIGFFVLFLMLWARGGVSRSPSDPTYLPVMSGIAVLSVILAIMSFMTSTMVIP